MPLVVPGLASNSDDKNAKWSSELLGKKIGDTKNETTFARKDLPKEHRIVEAGSMLTQDHKPDRLNIHTGDDGIVKKITHG